MATTVTARTFVLRPGHMTGDDVGEFQRELNSRYEAWDIAKRIRVDNDYGDDTRDAAREVCTGLGIDHRTAMEHGVTPELRIKIRHPDRRTPAEIHRSEGHGAKEFRAKLRKWFATVSASGVEMFDGRKVAAWIVPSLKWARAHGWTGHVTSGFRSCERQKVVAAQFAAEQHTTVAALYPHGPCASNHVGAQHPRGAVDVSNPAQLAEVLRNNPNHPKLVWGGPVINDPVHFSANGH
jgi:hypothetical protein